MEKRKIITALACGILVTGSITVTGWGADSVLAGDTSSLIASAEEMASPVKLELDGIEPVFGNSLRDGTYSIEVLSSSSMFRIAECELTVNNGSMNAVMKIESDSYLRLYMGTGAEAITDTDDSYIPYELDEDGNQLYTVPVEALDMEIECAAWSRRKEKWYDRTLVFRSSTLPKSALAEGMILTAEEIGLEDGTYLVDAVLEGGSGKTTVDSPVTMTVIDGSATAVVTIKSPHYDYVMVEGEKHERKNTEGNSTFEIPVQGFDWKMPIKANSIAMGTPREIDYTLYFDADTIEIKEN